MDFHKYKAIEQDGRYTDREISLFSLADYFELEKALKEIEDGDEDYWWGEEEQEELEKKRRRPLKISVPLGEEFKRRDGEWKKSLRLGLVDEDMEKEFFSDHLGNIIFTRAVNVETGLSLLFATEALIPAYGKMIWLLDNGLFKKTYPKFQEDYFKAKDRKKVIRFKVEKVDRMVRSAYVIKDQVGLLSPMSAKLDFQSSRSRKAAWDLRCMVKSNEFPCEYNEGNVKDLSKHFMKEEWIWSGPEVSKLVCAGTYFFEGEELNVWELRKKAEQLHDLKELEWLWFGGIMVAPTGKDPNIKRANDMWKWVQKMRDRTYLDKDMVSISEEFLTGGESHRLKALSLLFTLVGNPTEQGGFINTERPEKKKREQLEEKIASALREERLLVDELKESLWEFIEVTMDYMVTFSLDDPGLVGQRGSTTIPVWKYKPIGEEALTTLLGGRKPSRPVEL